MVEFWDERYSKKEFAYGEYANLFFADQLTKLIPGKVLLPAEGEGRNAVFAAKNGWSVRAFDISKQGKHKATHLAQEHDVIVDYLVGGFDNLPFEFEEFDAIGVIFAHFAPSLRYAYHRQLVDYLKLGGYIILEAFSKAQFDKRKKGENVGGPREISMLYSIEEIIADFADLDTIILEELEIELREGLYHVGISSVVRYVGRKCIR